MASSDLKGLLFDYEFCSGCHACEVACKKEHGFAQGQNGIRVIQIGPSAKPDGTWEYDYVPIPGELCDLCAERVARGKKPTCVHHCQAFAIQYGTIAELAERVDKTKMSLFVPPTQ